MEKSNWDDIFNYESTDTLSELNLDTLEHDEVISPSLTYKMDTGRLIGKIDGLGAIRQAVEKLLCTERFEWVIYSENYGVELDRLIGTSMDFVKSDLERTISDAILSDDRIDKIINFRMQEVDRDTLVAMFDVISVEGIFTMEQEVKVK